jgi:hypothetical protein
MISIKLLNVFKSFKYKIKSCGVLQVEKVLGECNPTTIPNVYHYYVEIEGQFDNLQECNIWGPSDG